MSKSDVIEHLRSQVLEITDRADRERRQMTPTERVEVERMLDRVKAIRETADEYAEPIAMEGGIIGVADDLHGAILKAGYDRRRRPSVQVSAADALGMRFKTGSFTGGNIEDDGVMDLEPSPELGADTRFLFPRLRTVQVGSDITSVQSYRQSSRTLADASLMVRDIDDVTEKPSTDTVSELLSAPMQQIATISKATPNVLLEHAGFRGWVQNDLGLAWRQAVDTHIVGEITTAVTTISAGGTNVYEDVLYAQSAVAAEGYTASLVVVSPADALAIQLLQLSGGSTYAFAVAPPTLVVSPSVSDGAGFVLDPAAAGTLYLSPARFEVFEENAGQTNTSTARFESHGTFVVQRPGAIALLSGGS
jgi:hypothetical protein